MTYLTVSAHSGSEEKMTVASAEERQPSAWLGVGVGVGGRGRGRGRGRVRGRVRDRGLERRPERRALRYAAGRGGDHPRP